MTWDRDWTQGCSIKEFVGCGSRKDEPVHTTTAGSSPENSVALVDRRPCWACLSSSSCSHTD